VNGFVRKEWKGQITTSPSTHVDNYSTTPKTLGLIYNPPITAKLTYEIAF